MPEDLRAKDPAGIRTWYGAEATFRTQSEIETLALFRKLQFFCMKTFLLLTKQWDRSESGVSCCNRQQTLMDRRPIGADSQTQSLVPGVRLQLFFAQGTEGILCPFRFLLPHSWQCERLLVQYEQHEGGCARHVATSVGWKLRQSQMQANTF